MYSSSTGQKKKRKKLKKKKRGYQQCCQQKQRLKCLEHTERENIQTDERDLNKQTNMTRAFSKEEVQMTYPHSFFFMLLIQTKRE